VALRVHQIVYRIRIAQAHRKATLARTQASEDLKSERWARVRFGAALETEALMRWSKPWARHSHNQLFSAAKRRKKTIKKNALLKKERPGSWGGLVLQGDSSRERRRQSKARTQSYGRHGNQKMTTAGREDVHSHAVAENAGIAAGFGDAQK